MIGKWKRYCDCLGRQWNSLLENSKTGLDKHAGNDMGLWSCFKAEMLTSPEVTTVPGLVQSVIVQKVPGKQFFVYIK